MKFKIKHEIKGRIRVRVIVKHMTAKEADLLEYALSNKEGITSVRVNERTADVVLCYKIDRATVLSYLRKCHVDLHHLSIIMLKFLMCICKIQVES